MYRNYLDIYKRFKNSALISALFLLLGLLLTSCSPAARSLFFDIPPPSKTQTEEETPAQEATPGNTNLEQQIKASELGTFVHPADLETNRPAIEEILDWNLALELLPKDSAGRPDWGAALNEGVIAPRALNPQDRAAESFQLDFYFKAANAMFDAFFPHSTHLQWMGCDSCHPALFKYRDNEITMATINQGQFCGACHGSVAFAATACKRCHLNMP